MKMMYVTEETKYKPLERPQAGFTLMELIIVLALIGILAVIAIPSLVGFSDSSTVTSAANDLVSSFNLAKSEAVTRGMNVTVCKSADQATCIAAGNWDQGWIVFTDDNGDGDVDVADNDTVLRVFQAPGRNATLVAAGNLVNRITYASTGFSGFNGNISVTAGARRLVVTTNTMGRVRTGQMQSVP